jgi:hypothetical protein
MAVLNVKTAAELTQALEACTGGETILCDAEIVNYEARGLAFDHPVTLLGRFRAAPATVNGQYQSWQSGLNLENCRGLMLGGQFAGTEKDGYFKGWGLRLWECSHVALVPGTLFTACGMGSFASGCSDLDISDADFVGMGSNGLQFSALQRVTIARNYFGRQRVNWPEGEHPDAIQFHSNGTGPSSDIIIADNCIDGHPDDPPQGIFFADEGKLKAHRNVVIRRNVMRNTLWTGIGVDGVTGLELADNLVMRTGLPSVRREAGFPVTQQRIAVYRSEVRAMTGNVASAYLGLDASGADVLVAPPPGNMAAELFGDEASDKVVADWRARFRAPAPAPVDPRIAERESLRISIPGDTAIRDALTKKLTKNRARLKALDKALGT